MAWRLAVLRCVGFRAVGRHRPFCHGLSSIMATTIRRSLSRHHCGLGDAAPPTEIEKQECREATKKAGHKTEECKSIWEKTTTDPVALFTFVLSLSTIGLWVATGIGILIQTRDTRILQRAY